MSIMLTIFDVSIKEKRFDGSLYFELLPQQMSQSKKNEAGRFGDLILNVYGIWRVTYVTRAVK